MRKLLLICGTLLSSAISYAAIGDGVGGQYIFNQQARQTGARFNVSSGTIAELFVTTITFRDGTKQITAAVSGSGSSALQVSLSGTQISSPTLSINFSSNVFTASQSPTGTANIGLNPGATLYIQNAGNPTITNQVFRVSSGSVAGPFYSQQNTLRVNLTPSATQAFQLVNVSTQQVYIQFLGANANLWRLGNDVTGTNAKEFGLYNETTGMRDIVVSTSDVVTIYATVNMPSFTASFPVKTDANKNLVSGLINPTTDITGIIPPSVLPSTIVYTNTIQTITGSKTFTSSQTFQGLLAGSTFTFSSGTINGDLVLITNQQYLGVGHGVKLINSFSPGGSTSQIEFFSKNSTGTYVKAADLTSYIDNLTNGTEDTGFALGFLEDGVVKQFYVIADQASSKIIASVPGAAGSLNFSENQHQLRWDQAYNDGFFLNSGNSRFGFQWDVTSGTRSIYLGGSGVGRGDISYNIDDDVLFTPDKFAFISSMTLSGNRLMAQTAPTNGQAVVWSSANNRWEPGTVSGGGGGIYPATATASFPYGFSFSTANFTSGNANAVLYLDANKDVTTDTGFTFDPENEGLVVEFSPLDSVDSSLTFRQDIGSVGAVNGARLINSHSADTGNSVSLDFLNATTGGIEVVSGLINSNLSNISPPGSGYVGDLSFHVPDGNESVGDTTDELMRLRGVDHAVVIGNNLDNVNYPIVFDGLTNDGTITFRNSDGYFLTPNQWVFNSSMTLSAGRLVSVSTPSNGQALIWSSGSSSWGPGTPIGSGDNLGDHVATTTINAGYGISATTGVFSGLLTGTTVQISSMTVGTYLEVGKDQTGGVIAFKIANTGPKWAFSDTDAGADGKNWDIFIAGNTMNYRVVSDSLGAALSWMEVARTDITSANVSFPGGKVSIGAGTPTAILHLKAGTATANTAPLKFNTGTVLATPETGAMEFSTPRLYFTTGTFRNTIAYLSDITSTGGGDNLGNHIATKTITAGYGISVTTIVASSSVSISGTIAVPNLTPGSVLFVDEFNNVGQKNGKLFWNNADPEFELSVGTNTTSTYAKIRTYYDRAVPNPPEGPIVNQFDDSSGNYAIDTHIWYKMYSYVNINGHKVYSLSPMDIGEWTILYEFGSLTVESTAPDTFDGFEVWRSFDGTDYVDSTDVGASPTLNDTTETSWTANDIGSGNPTDGNVDFRYNYRPGNAGALLYGVYGGAGYFDGHVGISTPTNENVNLSLSRNSTAYPAFKIIGSEHSSANPSAVSVVDSIGNENVGFTSWAGGGGSGGYGAVVVSGSGGAGIRLGEIGAKNQSNGFRLGDIVFETDTASDNGRVYLLVGTGSGSFGYGWYVNSSGRTGFRGNTTPTAAVHPAAGTTAASSAPLKFNTGSYMTTPEAGAFEWDNSTAENPTFSPTTAARYRIPLISSAPSAGLTVGRVVLTAASGRLFDSSEITYSTFTHTVTVSSLTVTLQSTQTISSGGTIAADTCGGMKRITSASAVTTSTTNTFTAPATSNAGCMMWIVNVGTNTITLDNNANFKSAGAADVAMTQDDAVLVGSLGNVWYQFTALEAN